MTEITRHFYLRNTAGHPVGVVALRRKAGNFTRVSYSLCSKHDQFSKKLGVTKAVGRLSEDLNRSFRGLTVHSFIWYDSNLHGSILHEINNLMALNLYDWEIDRAHAHITFTRLLQDMQKDTAPNRSDSPAQASATLSG